MSWIRSLLINQIHENDLTLAIEPDSLRSVSSTDGVKFSLLLVLFELAISFILTFVLDIAPPGKIERLYRCAFELIETFVAAF